ncbi:hypothetical protein EST38_g2899 [Candolleomyces aberdarensis]|uniref:Ribosomal protein L15 n=1 Tax=Candolleomyces aberdarensis TaxID=2316362 RepID=A0A4Q2DTF3_9AGAR|nr:hypothetical protein EST38_g2899 [Candolleomyces aberdarensis]
MTAGTSGEGANDSRDSEYRQAACDDLLAEQNCDLDEERVSLDEETDPHRDVLSEELRSKAAKKRAASIRIVALICTCSLSIGSHYANYILGPLKSRMQREIGASHAEFGLLIAAYTLNSTWTPLVGGVLASRLGTTVTSILATGVIFLGQVILLIGDIWGDVRLMVLGLFVFGIGSHGLGVSMAFGLVAGKGASFIAASTSYPLTKHFGGRAPFYVATSLAGLSVVVNLIYIACSKWLVDGAGAELEAPDIQEEAHRREPIDITEAQALEKVAKKRHVDIRQVVKLGDAFWAYVGLNIFCGMIWVPFIHLAPNLIEKRYGLSEEIAANQASYLLVGPIVLYPLCGFLVDNIKRKSVVTDILRTTSVLTFLGYLWLSLPPTVTKTPIPAITSYAIGHGMSPLLLAIIVPRIVPSKYISTALGVHKSLEQTGNTLFQTVAGLLLDTHGKMGGKAAQYLLNTFVVLNLLLRKVPVELHSFFSLRLYSPISIIDVARPQDPQDSKMGAYKYIGELYKKKQSDVLRFLLRVRCWEYRQLKVIHRASRPSRPDKARRLGYKAKQGYVVYRIRVRRGNRKKHVPKGATYGKPVHQGVTQLKPQRSLKSVAEERVGRRCGNLRVLNSYWINQDGVYKYFEVILVDPSHKAIRRDPRINWIVNPVHTRREARGLTSAGKSNRGLGKGSRHNHAPSYATWKRHNTLSLRRYR